jgi:hypothetical protein
MAVWPPFVAALEVAGFFPIYDPTCLMIGESVVRFPLFAGLEGPGPAEFAH